MIDLQALFRIGDDSAFERAALDVFRFQAERCEPYREYLRLIGIRPERVETTREIPFLPIELFKTRRIYCSDNEPQQVFTSSSTTGQTPAKHYVADLSIYEQAFTLAFERFYGPVDRMAIFALLPSYLEREGSSLIYMADRLIRQGDSICTTTMRCCATCMRTGDRKSCSASAMRCGIWPTGSPVRCPERSSWRPAA